MSESILTIAEIIQIDATIIAGSLILFSLIRLLTEKLSNIASILLGGISVAFSLSAISVLLSNLLSISSLYEWGEIFMVVGFMYLGAVGLILSSKKIWK